jgi:hypothetical protein
MISLDTVFLLGVIDIIRNYLGGLVSCFLCNKRQTVVVFSMLNALFDIYHTHVGLEKSAGETPLEIMVKNSWIMVAKRANVI